jgi:hypothetical protein
MEKLDHLADHTLGYWEHWRHSMKLSIRLTKMMLKSTVHAFFPNTFANDGPTEIWNIYTEIKDLPNVNRMFTQFDATVKTK